MNSESDDPDYSGSFEQMETFGAEVVCAAVQSMAGRPFEDFVNLLVEPPNADDHGFDLSMPVHMCNDGDEIMNIGMLQRQIKADQFGTATCNCAVQSWYESAREGIYYIFDYNILATVDTDVGFAKTAFRVFEPATADDIAEMTEIARERGGVVRTVMLSFADREAIQTE